MIERIRFNEAYQDKLESEAYIWALDHTSPVNSGMNHGSLHKKWAQIMYFGLLRFYQNQGRIVNVRLPHIDRD